MIQVDPAFLLLSELMMKQTATTSSNSTKLAELQKLAREIQTARAWDEHLLHRITSNEGDAWAALRDQQQCGEESVGATTTTASGASSFSRRPDRSSCGETTSVANEKCNPVASLSSYMSKDRREEVRRDVRQQQAQIRALLRQMKEKSLYHATDAETAAAPSI